MEHTVYSTDLGEWPINVNNEAKEHWIRKGSSTCKHKDLSFEESAVPRTDREPEFRTSSKDYLLAVTFLVLLSNETSFVTERPKGKSTFLLQVIWNSQNSFITSFNEWKYAGEYIDFHERTPNRSSSIKIPIKTE